MTIADGLLGFAELPRLPISPQEIERARALAARRPHPADLADAVITLVERVAADDGDRPAVADDARRLTYAELAAEARRLATLLEREGAGPGTVVAVGGERGAAVIAAFLAIELIGAVYVPADGTWPAARVTEVLTRAGAVLLLDTGRETVTPAFAEAARGAGVRLVRAAEAAGLPRWSGPARLDGPDQPRYMLFTSGSTGRPKGAVVEHQGMLNHLHAKVVDLDMTVRDTVAQTAPLGFDISIWQMLCPLVVGGRVRVVGDATAYDSVAFARLIGTEAITIVELVPTMVRLLLDDLATALTTGPLSDTAATLETATLETATPATGLLGGLRWMLATGEELPTEVARRWLREMPHAGLVNAYGPTECSDDVTHHTVTPADLELLRLPIGTPIINTDLYVLRRDNDGWHACEPGESGELFVGGVCVGRGYAGDHDRTREAFFQDPFADTPTGRLYRTGDAVRALPRGALQYLGRVDRQVKIAGVRMELGEIEAVLQRHPSVGAVAVVVQDFATLRRH
ncbi:amino acid adenylation domain-containing protein [Nonomuraea sp. NEAU-A123]|uniref:amino acid adenylation domain-containing protein n=1 Tax=Nonomuraea sp. NEAU-A123 TaxID=2839649 RepID=UPI001BE4308F|nr:amino acid adenylation domain-containing protein [Nonomuraea sp. NEAU-A123]MBT2234826.1 amino acid adenylation domain-containing protein [Nonomuraea sp. NEAU-A123]